jgi:hypothetical protein
MGSSHPVKRATLVRPVGSTTIFIVPCKYSPPINCIMQQHHPPRQKLSFCQTDISYSFKWSTLKIGSTRLSVGHVPCQVDNTDLQVGPDAVDGENSVVADAVLRTEAAHLYQQQQQRGHQQQQPVHAPVCHLHFHSETIVPRPRKRFER